MAYIATPLMPLQCWLPEAGLALSQGDPIDEPFGLYARGWWHDICPSNPDGAVTVLVVKHVFNGFIAGGLSKAINVCNSLWRT
ncbi:hypothetical protein [Vibrio owensii]|uniref:hypothetical protein n=1 Tax=Vibrio owensii TaxID=696485 RepID=UPI0040697E60